MRRPAPRDRTRLCSVAATDQNNMFALYERAVTGKSCQGCLTPADGKGQTHAGDRTGTRFLGRPEVSMPIDVGKAHRSLDGPSCSQERSKHDAAITAQHDGKATAAACRFHALAERPAIRGDIGFVPRPARWTNIVPIRGRYDIAKIAGTQALHQAKVAENSWGAIKLPGLAAVVRTDAYARRCSHDCDAALHG
jgi:hypothetical protein